MADVCLHHSNPSIHACMNDSSFLAENTPFCSLENCTFKEQLKIYHPEHQHEEDHKGLQVSYHIILQQNHKGPGPLPTR